MPHRHIYLAADSLAAGSAVGFGFKILSDVELMVSILAGLLVACSAGLSIFLNWQRWKKEKQEESLNEIENPAED